MQIEPVSFIFTTFTPVVLGTIVGFLFRTNDWYKNLKKPSFTPPNVAFSIVWPILYILIGLAAYFALVGQTWDKWILFVIQLVCNLLFSPITFGLQSTLGGAIITTLTLLFALATTIQFGLAGSLVSVGLFAPYIVWLVYATILAWTVFVLN